MPATAFLRRACALLLLFELALGAAHLLWPQYRWGQGRDSYFNFSHSLTLASWLASMQFVAVAVLASPPSIGRGGGAASRRPRTWPWLAGAALALLCSIAEMTRFPDRLQLLGLPEPDVYQAFVLFGLAATCLALVGWFVFARLASVPAARAAAIGWLAAWTLKLILTILTRATDLVSARWHAVVSLADGLAYLVGGTLLLLRRRPLRAGGRRIRASRRRPQPPHPGHRSSTAAGC